MKPEIKEIFSADVADLAAWAPNYLEDIYVGLQLMIGPAGEPGADMFQLLVATPQALRAHRLPGSRPSYQYCLVVHDYDWPEIRSKIEQIVAGCEGNDWLAIAEKLARHFRWEFQDYKW